MNNKRVGIVLDDLGCSRSASNHRACYSSNFRKTVCSLEFLFLLFQDKRKGKYATFGLTEGDIDLTITDITGKEVLNKKVNVVNALSLFNLDVKNGVYFVKITSNNKSIVKKLIIQQ